MAIDYNTGEFPYNNQENYNRRRPTVDPDDELYREVPKGDSMTVPGQTLTIKQIMERALNGIKPDLQESPFFDVEDLEMLQEFPIDLTDLDESRAHLVYAQRALDEAIVARDEESARVAEEEQPEVEDDAT